MSPIAVSEAITPKINGLKATVGGGDIMCPYNTYPEYLKENPDFPAKYPRFLPYDDEEGAAPHGEFKHQEPAARANPAMPNLLKDGVVLEELTPHIGTVVHNCQLTSLSPAGLDELALLAAKRGVLVFKNQDLADAGPEKAVELGKHMGPLHHHPIMWRVKGHMDLQIVYEGPEPGGLKTRKHHDWANSTSCMLWHSDQTHEPQPPGVSFLAMLEGPKTGSGGDTLFSSTVASYNALSPAFQKVINPLWCEHTSKRQVARSIATGGVGRREGASVAHPMVLVHPVTGDRALYISRSFGGLVHGMKKQESELLVNFLSDHIAHSQEFQCRIKWSEGDVAVYDQRVVQHSPMTNFPIGSRRHLLRITPLGGRPKATPEAGERPEIE